MKDYLRFVERQLADLDYLEDRQKHLETRRRLRAHFEKEDDATLLTAHGVRIEYEHGERKPLRLNLRGKSREEIIKTLVNAFTPIL